jgi:hypothetical protein
VTETIESMVTPSCGWRSSSWSRPGAEGIELIGPGGLLTGLTKSVLVTALEAEMSEHLGYDKHDPMGRNGAQRRRRHSRVSRFLQALPSSERVQSGGDSGWLFGHGR